LLALLDHAVAVLGCASLDHRDVDVAVCIALSSNDDLEHGFFALFIGWEWNPLTIGECKPDRADRAFERNRADREGSRRSAFSDARPSRRKNDPGIRPTA
jgi:hypothetical protein